MNNSVSSSVAAVYSLETQGGIIFAALVVCATTLASVALVFWGRGFGCACPPEGMHNWFCCMLGQWILRKWCRCPSRWRKELERTLKESDAEEEELESDL